MLAVMFEVVEVVEDIGRGRGQTEQQAGQQRLTHRRPVGKPTGKDQRSQDKAVLDPLLRTHEPDEGQHNGDGRRRVSSRNDFSGAHALQSSIL